MLVSEITRDTVESGLRTLRSGGLPDPNILNLDCIPLPAAATPEERAIALEDLLDELIWQAYAGMRESEGWEHDRPVSRDAILVQIGQDFSANNQDLEAWSALYHRYRAVLSLSVEELAEAASMVTQQFRRRLNQGLDFLVQQLRRLEMQAHHQQSGARKNAAVPLPDYTRLIGALPYFQRLDAQLNQADGAQMVSLEGIGGIGKTALAHGFIDLPQTTNRWPRILWVSARQYILNDAGEIARLADTAATLADITARLADQLGLPHLSSKTIRERMDGIQAALTLESCLIVIDNLETVSEYIELVPTLARAAGKSSFLLTTRQTLRRFPFVHTIQLGELSVAESYELLLAESSRLGRKVELDQDSFKELYRLIGGIPLAIKLVASQLLYRPLDEILTGFREAQGGTDSLYRYLYWHTWQLLSDPARHLLLSFLPADPEGEDLDFIQLMSGLNEESFPQALRELDHFSLLEISGDGHTPRYRLHRLTVTFLQTDILKLWETDTPDEHAGSFA